MLNKNGYEIPEWRIEQNEKQMMFETRLNAIVKALADAGHEGWDVEHVVDPDQEFNAGLKSYYGTATIKNRSDFVVDGKRAQGFNIVLWMSQYKGEKNKAYFSVSHRELERYSEKSDETINVGIDITRAPEKVAGELIRRVIFPARTQNEILDVRHHQDIQRRAGIVMICGELVESTKGVLKALLDPDKLRDKNVGAELKYSINYNTKIEGKVSYYAETVDLNFDDLTPEQARKLLEFYHSMVTRSRE
jgi:hypothetical protein